ncbi:MAG TPA: hypothetical protein VL979_01495 [Solirubrobacteraceae bacterium]|nr:hypothetical protein [Solirubrobacteraceae bacterium]
MREENKIQTILAGALDGAAQVLPVADQAHDFLLKMSDGSTIAIDARWAGEGWPQDIRNALSASRAADDVSTVIVARHLSSGSIELLRDHDANWADESGQARIIGPHGLLVIREPAARRKREPNAFTWSPSALSIAETLLASPDRPVLTEELAELSGWSASRTASVLKAFDARGWTVKRGPARGPRAYRELSDAEGMLDAWSHQLIDAPREARYAHRATRDAMGLLTAALRPALDEHVQWAVSGWAGLELVAPYATGVPSLHIYVPAEDFVSRLSVAVKAAGLLEVKDAGLITFWAAERRVLRIASTHRGIPVVSPPRLYADLDGLGARGQDAAAHVRRELIEPLHAHGLRQADHG